MTPHSRNYLEALVVLSGKMNVTEYGSVVDPGVVTLEDADGVVVVRLGRTDPGDPAAMGHLDTVAQMLSARSFSGSVDMEGGELVLWADQEMPGKLQEAIDAYRTNARAREGGLDAL